jgi:hypothetical protein
MCLAQSKEERMASALYLWAVGERIEIMEDIKWFNAGATLNSPSGDDITKMKLRQLKGRLSELDKVLRQIDDA